MSTSNTTRAAVYLRQSLDRDQTQLAIERQREDCLKLCEARQWTPTLYVDNDVSATDGRRRPAYRQMLDDITAGKVDAVVAFDADRLHRLPRELEDFIDLADTHKLALATVGGDFDLSSPTGRGNARMKGVFARMEGEQKSMRQKRAALQKAQSGKPQWRKAFGYRKGADGMELDPVTAPLVTDAYAALIAGTSLGGIVKLFNDAGAHGLNGKPWSASTVSLFLRKPRNAGIREYQGSILRDDEGNPVMGAWPPLVSREVWDAAQAVLANPSRRPGRKSVRRHLLTGVVHCGKCGGPLAGGHSNTGHVIYVCKGCRGVSIRAHDLENMLYGMLAVRFSRADAVDKLLVKLDADEAQQKATADELNALYSRKGRLPKLWTKGLMTDVEYAESRTELDAAISQLLREQDYSNAPNVLEGAPLGEDAAVNEEWLRDQSDRFRMIVTSLASVVVKPCGKGGYRWDAEKGVKVVDPDRVVVDWRRAALRSC